MKTLNQKIRKTLKIDNYKIKQKQDFQLLTMHSEETGHSGKTKILNFLKCLQFKTNLLVYLIVLIVLNSTLHLFKNKVKLIQSRSWVLKRLMVWSKRFTYTTTSKHWEDSGSMIEMVRSFMSRHVRVHSMVYLSINVRSF